MISSRLQPDQKRIKREANATEELGSNLSGTNVGEAAFKVGMFVHCASLTCHSVHAVSFLFLKALNKALQMSWMS